MYIGSFWDGPCMNPDMARFFNAEQSDLLRDLHVRGGGGGGGAGAGVGAAPHIPQ